MTKNQIEYQKLLETRRSNLAQERQKSKELAETTRHNYMYENETHRHNAATEAVSLQELGIKGQQAKASLKQADVAAYNAQTNRLHQQETARSNRVHESIGMKNVDVAAYNAQTNRLHQQETARSNRVYESIGMKNAAANAQQAVNSQMQAQAALKQASVAEQNAYISRDLADSKINLETTQAARNEAETALINKDVKYRGQENVRDWINTGSKALSSSSQFMGSIIQGMSSTVKLIGGLS